MIIWLALFVPICTALALYWKFQRQMAWWEYLVPTCFALLFIWIFKWSVQTRMTRDTEYWGTYVTEVRYYEDWNEYIQQTCYRECCCDDKGQNCMSIPYDCSYVAYHAAEYYAVDNTGESFWISEKQYEAFVKRFGSPTRTELNRDYHSDDGDLWSAAWNGQYDSYEFIATKHYYTNKVQATSNLYRFPSVSKAEVQQHHLKEYPLISTWRKLPGILSDSLYPVPKSAQKKLDWLNGHLGSKKEVRVWMVILKNQPQEAGMLQEAYWKGGNMNEVNVFIGVDSKHAVSWCYVSSWTEVPLLKIRIRDYINSMDTLDLQKAIDFLHMEIDQRFVRKDFNEFNYLTVEPPGWAILVTFLVTLCMSVFISFWLVQNGFTEAEPMGEYRSYW